MGFVVDSGARRTGVRQIPEVVRGAVTLVWRSGPRTLLATIGFQVVSSASVFLQVLLVKQTLDAILRSSGPGGSVSAAALPVSLLAALAATTAVVGTVVSLRQRVLGELVSNEIWRRLLDVSDSVDLSNYEDPNFYDQAQRVQLNAAAKTLAVTNGLVGLIGGSLGLIAGTTAVLALAPSLLPLLLLSGVPLYFASRRASRLEFAFAVAQSPRYRELNYLQRLLTGREEAKEVRAFSLAGPLRQRWEHKLDRYVGELRRHMRQRTKIAVIGNGLAATLTATTLGAILVLIDRGHLDIASAGAALVAVRLLGSQVSQASGGLSSILESALFLQDMRAFVARSAPSTDIARPKAPGAFDEIKVEGVSFTYPAAPRPSLSQVSLTIRCGEVVALVGENGSGKTTLAKLVAALYEPDLGQVTWDGVDLRAFDPDSIRRRIAVIFQDFVRFQLTAADNIALGRADEAPAAATIRAAACQSGADDFLARLQYGYDTILSKEFFGGTDLSQGQWQRVALARAFIRDAPLVILDEPSAALDARAEHDLFAHIRALLDGRTVLLISHRFSTVRTADRIYVLHEGRIVEQGDHRSLIEQGGRYAELFHLQTDALGEHGRRP